MIISRRLHNYTTPPALTSVGRFMCICLFYNTYLNMESFIKSFMRLLLKYYSSSFVSYGTREKLQPAQRLDNHHPIEQEQQIHQRQPLLNNDVPNNPPQTAVCIHPPSFCRHQQSLGVSYLELIGVTTTSSLARALSPLSTSINSQQPPHPNQSPRALLHPSNQINNGATRR